MRAFVRLVRCESLRLVFEMCKRAPVAIVFALLMDGSILAVWNAVIPLASYELTEPWLRMFR